MQALNELPKLSVRAAEWTDYKWEAKYSEGQTELRFLILRPSVMLLGMVCAVLLGYDSTAFALVWEDFNHTCTNRDLLLPQYISVANSIKP